MSKKKFFALLMSASFAVMVLLPASIVWAGGTKLFLSEQKAAGYGLAHIGKNGDGTDFKGKKISTPREIKIWREKTGKCEVVDFEEYVVCVVASEMPSSFHAEALKAQSVAARTYAMAKLAKIEVGSSGRHGEAALCDTVHCQVYRPDSELRALHSEEWYSGDKGIKKIRRACEATDGELLYYDGELVLQPLFFSSSGGQTENSEDVFAGAYPYLVSVSSPYEEKASHRNEQKTFAMGDFAAAIRAIDSSTDFGRIGADTVKILERTSGGRVSKIKVGEAVLKGTQIRSALGLSSALFSVSFASDEGGGETVTFTSNGSGHGVGLSQYGADGMALKGANYKEILSHYYSGTEVF